MAWAMALFGVRDLTVEMKTLYVMDNGNHLANEMFSILIRLDIEQRGTRLFRRSIEEKPGGNRSIFI
jgi:hypothetical protein